MLHEAVKKNLSPTDEDNLITIPCLSNELLKRFKSMSSVVMNIFLDLTPSSSLLRACMSVHDCSGHLSFDVLFRMLEAGILPKRVLTLKTTYIECSSFFLLRVDVVLGGRSLNLIILVYSITLNQVRAS